MKSIKMLLLAAISLLSASAFAQTKATDSTVKATTSTAIYACSMHPEVTSTKPGKCTKCGMELTKVKTYSCSMHPEITSTKPGKCTKCGMELTEVKGTPKKMKM